MLALANSGGGYVLIAFRKAQARCVPSLERLEWLDGYSQDTANDILRGRAFSPAREASIQRPTGAPSLQCPRRNRRGKQTGGG
jgi:hypothetical protein